jgi:Type II secretion system (T2SS), protein M subtype b
MTATARKAWLSRQGVWGLAILLIAILAMSAIAALPYYWNAMASAQLNESRNELHFVEAKLKSAKRTQRIGLSAADNIEPLFTSGATSGLALADLQRLVGNIAEVNGMVIERTQPLQTEYSNGLAVLRMEVEASGSIENLRGYLLAIETGQPLIFVNSAKISASESQTENAVELPSDKLTVALQLEAYGWWEAAP